MDMKTDLCSEIFTPPPVSLIPPTWFNFIWIVHQGMVTSMGIVVSSSQVTLEDVELT